MTIPNKTPEDIRNMDPGALFLFLTSYIYDARQRGALDDVAGVLSVFDDGARRALLVGSSALMAMAPGEYREAMERPMAKTLYNYFNGRNKNGIYKA
jgi:hypothetical protein